MDLSVIIPARNEMFLQRTIDRVFLNTKANTEVIVLLDGYWPDPPLNEHPKLTVVHVPQSIGQRAATNAGARLSRARFVMKLDAHCDVDMGFDVKLMEDYEPDWTIIPMMYNLHGFDWKCRRCGDRTFQGPLLEVCEQCNTSSGFDMEIVWCPNWRKLTLSWRFDKELRFQYWHAHRKRPETRRGKYIETMSFIGACFFMSRERYWQLDGLDERHGSWGQVGTEIACKSWLSGGKLLTSKKTWFSHLFRTRHGQGFGFPYPISGRDQEIARQYSYNFWTNNMWPKQVHKLEWLVEKFKPVPDWHE